MHKTCVVVSSSIVVDFVDLGFKGVREDGDDTSLLALNAPAVAHTAGTLGVTSNAVPIGDHVELDVFKAEADLVVDLVFDAFSLYALHDFVEVLEGQGVRVLEHKPLGGR